MGYLDQTLTFADNKIYYSEDGTELKVMIVTGKQ